jgi:protein-tyrosine phosphatase
MDLVQLDDHGTLFLSPDVDDWDLLRRENIGVIVDLDGGLDSGVPLIPNHTVYVYFPFDDAHVPDRVKLHAIARLAATLVGQGNKVLSHCGLGYNRSALLAGLILRYLGVSGSKAVEILRRHRPGALYNEAFAEYVLTCELDA